MKPGTNAELLIGPLLRRVVGTRATVWVETSAPAHVQVKAGDAGGESHTFTAFGHHYALVVVEGLAPGSTTPYEVFVDGSLVWPEADSRYPRSVIRTREGDDAAQPVRLVFGSCRETTQHVTARKLPPDAMDAYARRLMLTDEPAPDLLVLLGDQVYADIPSPAVKRFLRRHRKHGHHGPAHEVVSYEEYTQLYMESWRDPEIRWLYASVPSVMIFDDHEIIDDWNSSAAWRADILQQPWWTERVSSGLASYWVYQHLGNMEPDELANDPVYQKVLAAEDATEVLREFAIDVDANGGYQWSYSLDVGRTRLVVLDNRCSRVVEPGRRAMVPPEEWRWFIDQVHGDYDHLVVGSSLPWLLPQGVHHLEAWNEKIAASHRPRVSAFAERVRRAFDLEHWAAFHESFDALAALFARIGESGAAPAPGPAASGLRSAATREDGALQAPGPARAERAPASAASGRVGTGPAYPPPASISVLSGDVHHSYVARALFDTPVTAPVHQLTCSPVHNQVPSFMRPMLQVGWWRGPATAARALARAARVAAPTVRWRKIAGPYFGNAVGTLDHDGRSAHVTIEGTTTDGALRTVAAVDLS